MDQTTADKHAQMFAMNQRALSEASEFHDWMLQQHADTDTIWFVKRSHRLVAWADCRIPEA
jgi:hypothetical protein